MDRNLAVYYSGASGGCFFALTLALATQDTHKISSTHSIQEIISKNWKVKDYGDWDNHQVKYDHSYVPWNPSCEGVSVRKCNEIIREGDALKNRNKNIDNIPTIIKYDDFIEMVDENATSIMIYTDVDTQFALMKLKRRGVFHKEMDTFAYICEAMDDAGLRKPSIDNWESEFKMGCSEMYGDIRIFSKMIKSVVLDGVDHVFLLQDVVSTKFKCVTDALGLEHTKEVSEHVDFWVSLHPLNIQKMLLK